MCIRDSLGERPALRLLDRDTRGIGGRLGLALMVLLLAAAGWALLCLLYTSRCV